MELERHIEAAPVYDEIEKTPVPIKKETPFPFEIDPSKINEILETPGPAKKDPRGKPKKRIDEPDGGWKN